MNEWMHNLLNICLYTEVRDNDHVGKKYVVSLKLQNHQNWIMIDKFFQFPFLFILTCNPDGYINENIQNRLDVQFNTKRT